MFAGQVFIPSTTRCSVTTTIPYGYTTSKKNAVCAFLRTYTKQESAMRKIFTAGTRGKVKIVGTPIY